MVTWGAPEDSGTVVPRDIGRAAPVYDLGRANPRGGKNGTGSVDSHWSGTVLSLLFTTLFDPYGNPVTLGLSAEALLLSIVAGTLFFYLAIPFVMLRQAAGWFTLVGSIAVVTVGLLMVSTVIKAT